VPGKLRAYLPASVTDEEVTTLFGSSMLAPVLSHYQALIILSSHRY
jgi:hypothetical protein